MIRFLLRFIGFWTLAGAFVALVVDGTRSIGSARLVFTSVRDGWLMVSPAGLERTQALVADRAAWAWSDLATPVLGLPLAAVLAVLGLLLLTLGRPRRGPRYLAN